jgi:hypothetical protein
MRREMTAVREMARVSDQIPFLTAMAMKRHSTVH